MGRASDGTAQIGAVTGVRQILPNYDYLKSLKVCLLVDALASVLRLPYPPKFNSTRAPVCSTTHDLLIFFHHPEPTESEYRQHLNLLIFYQHKRSRHDYTH